MRVSEAELLRRQFESEYRTRKHRVMIQGRICIRKFAMWKAPMLKFMLAAMRRKHVGSKMRAAWNAMQIPHVMQVAMA